MARRTSPDGGRLSVVRLCIVALVLTLVGLGLSNVFGEAVERVRAEAPRAFFAPYVDVTLTPTFHFEDPVEAPHDDLVLSFVVASPLEPCGPSWGGHYSLDEAARALDLDRRITRLRDRGGDVVVSFGGIRNAELATTCRDIEHLTAAYREVIDRYGLTVIDLDIEGAALADTEANQRRAEAMAALQREAEAKGSKLDVWLTLPVAPTGVTAESVALIDTMLRARVDLSGVNAMTMNYGASRDGMSMTEATKEALDATFVQLSSAYQRAGISIEDEAVWLKIGATPMIGQNDEPEDVFTIDDGWDLIDFAARRGMGRISMWSMNRDVSCGAQVDVRVAQNVCSGLDQEPLEFTFAFAELPEREARQRAEAAERTPAAAVDLTDDPGQSPYRIWRSNKVYVAGDKVVWHRRVYEAKWWTQGDVPDAPVEHVWDTPWRYLGPVMPGEGPRSAATPAPTEVAGAVVTSVPGAPAAPVVPPSTVAEPAGTVIPGVPTTVIVPRGLGLWEPGKAYVEGDVVLYEGVRYEARWWNSGEPPDPDPDTPWDSPWVPLDE